MSKNKIFLIAVGAVALVSSVLGWINYFHNVSVFSVITWPLIWLGLFVWGDAMILGAFIFGACVVLWFKNNPVLTGLFFSAYYMIRSFIEALYNLNAQFSPVSRPWEAFIPAIAEKYHFKIMELYVVPQITYTAVCVTSLVIFVTFLKMYFHDETKGEASKNLDSKVKELLKASK